MRILLVEDEENVRISTVAVLEHAGHEVIDVASVEAARLRLAQTQFDVAILDRNLGREKGTDLIETLRATCPGIMIVVLSGDTTTTVQGADVTLTKSQSPADLLKAIERLQK